MSAQEETMILVMKQEKVAFELYEKAGGWTGSDQQHWFEAERILGCHEARKDSDVKPAGRRAVAASKAARVPENAAGKCRMPPAPDAGKKSADHVCGVLC